MKARMLAFHGLALWTKPHKVEKSTEFGWTATRLSHVDAGRKG